jgi:hypothetical protein
LKRCQEYGGDPRKYRPGTRVRQRGLLAAVVDVEAMVVITVLQRKQEVWGRQAETP